MLVQSGVKQPYQSPAAEQDHEDDEGLEPAVFHNLIAGLPQPPPSLAQTTGSVHLTAATVLPADWEDIYTAQCMQTKVRLQE